MSSTSKNKWAKVFRFTARVLGLTYGILVFTFALFSGSEAYGNDFMAVVKNSSNTLP